MTASLFRMSFAALTITLTMSTYQQSWAQTSKNQPPSAAEQGNMLVYAVAWKQTAAEYKALYHQAFNIARMRLDEALNKKQAGEKPLAVITDIDDTIFNASDYWGYLIRNDMDFFDDALWDAWVPENKFVATPGSLDFLNYADSKDVQIFYISNRDQGAKTYEYAIGNLKSLGFPQIDNEHVIIQIETSDKEAVQKKIMEKYDVVVMLGDNLNDFQRKYYVKNVDERMKLMEEDKDLFGNKFILLPNPTDGHWIRAIFGDSEPPASAESRKIFRKAAGISASISTEDKK